LKFELPKDSFGEFILVMKFSDGITTLINEVDVFLPSSGGITGRLISEGVKGRLSLIGIIVVGVAAVGAVVWSFVRFKKKVRRVGKKYKRVIRRSK